MNEFVLLLSSWQFWKSVISGGITAAVDLLLLFIFREKLQWSYWSAINTAFSVSILVNFSLQKFWAFSSLNLTHTYKQFIKFLVVSLVNMTINNLAMYLLAIVFGLWYLGAQIITIGILSAVNFLLYRNVVFK